MFKKYEQQLSAIDQQPRSSDEAEGPGFFIRQLGLSTKSDVPVISNKETKKQIDGQLIRNKQIPYVLHSFIVICLFSFHFIFIFIFISLFIYVCGLVYYSNFVFVSCTFF